MIVMNPHKPINVNEPQPDELRHFLLKDLLESRNVDWSWINKTFKNSPASFEDILFRIHYKRKKLLPGKVFPGYCYFFPPAIYQPMTYGILMNSSGFIKRTIMKRTWWMAAWSGSMPTLTKKATISFLETRCNTRLILVKGTWIK